MQFLSGTFQIMNDDKELLKFLTLLDEVGLVIVKNAPKQPGQVTKICERVAFPKRSNYG